MEEIYEALDRLTDVRSFAELISMAAFDMHHDSQACALLVATKSINQELDEIESLLKQVPKSEGPAPTDSANRSGRTMKSKILDVHEPLSAAKSLADAINMACADLGPGEEQDALNALANTVSKEIKCAMSLLDECLKEAA